MNKILFITNVYPNICEPFRGIYIHNRAAELNKNGFDCKIAFLDKAKRKTIDNFSKSFEYTHKASKFNYFGLGKKPKIEKGFYQFLNDFKPDLIIFCVTSFWLKRLIIKKLKTFNFANFFEGRNADGQYRDHKLYSLLIKNKEKRIYKKMKYLLFCSPLAEDDFKIKFPKIDKQKCHTLLNGFDINTFSPAKKHIFDMDIIKIIAIGNIEKAKGQIILAKAIENVSEKYNKKIIVEIVGTGRGEDICILNKILDKPNIKYIYKQQLKPNEVKEELNKFDYFILPSYFESFGCVYLEAMSQGLISIGCKNQGPSLYIVNNENGLLVDENNSFDLENCLINIITNKIDVNRLSKAAIETSKQFGWNVFANSFKKLFSEL